MDFPKMQALVRCVPNSPPSGGSIFPVVLRAEPRRGEVSKAGRTAGGWDDRDEGLHPCSAGFSELPCETGPTRWSSMSEHVVAQIGGQGC